MIKDLLQAHLEKETVSFHMPGHKNGRGFMGTPLESSLFAYDTTELPDTDALIEPTGALLEAEKYAASLYNANHSFFMVNGSTGGILTMIYTAFAEDDLVLVDRNCHQSVLNGLTLAGARPIYITPENSEIEAIPGTVGAETIERAINQHPEIKGAIITSPNYYGKVADIKKIATLLHNNKAILLVDEAHGAHFPMSHHFPESAISLGADMSVTSLHKTLCAPNQTALLHIGKQYAPEEVRKVLRMFQTSSPSYILLMAIEEALKQGTAQGEEKTREILGYLQEIPHRALDDPFKLLLSFSHIGISGFEAEKILREEFGIYAELATSHHVLCMCSFYNTKEDFERLKNATEKILAMAKSCPLPVQNTTPQPKIEKSLFSLKELRKKTSALVPLTDAEGCICKTCVTIFPPCIPVLLPGEVITKDKVDYILYAEKNHLTVTGLTDGKIAICK